jgi:hypothetical protein
VAKKENNRQAAPQTVSLQRFHGVNDATDFPHVDVLFCKVFFRHTCSYRLLGHGSAVGPREHFERRMPEYPFCMLAGPRSM